MIIDDPIHDFAGLNRTESFFIYRKSKIRTTAMMHARLRILPLKWSILTVGRSNLRTNITF
jgi:hypothetical protein